MKNGDTVKIANNSEHLGYFIGVIKEIKEDTGFSSLSIFSGMPVSKGPARVLVEARWFDNIYKKERGDVEQKWVSADSLTII